MSNSATQAIARVKGFKMPSFGKFGGLMKREFLDHKVGFFWVPLIISGFMIFGFVASAIIGNNMLQNMDVFDHLKDGQIVVGGEHASIEDAQYFLDRLNNMDLQALRRALGIGMLGVLMPFLFAIPIIILFGLLGSLYDDRRDKSYLFWKSMPVSDTTEVLSKLFAITIMGPACVIAFAAVVQVVWMAVESLIGAAHGLPVGSFLWHNVPTVDLWFGMLSMTILSVIWALPVIGWLTFVSSVAKKAPLLVAVVPIAAITALEAVFNHSTIFIKWIVDRLIGWVVELQGIDFGHVDVGEKLSSPFIGGAWDRLMEGMATGQFWFSTAIGVAFITGAIYMRRYNT